MDDLFVALGVDKIECLKEVEGGYIIYTLRQLHLYG